MGDIVRHTLEELKRMKGETRPDAPEGPELGDVFWANARVSYPPHEFPAYLKLDDDVAAHLRDRGEDVERRMNAILRQHLVAPSLQA